MYPQTYLLALLLLTCTHILPSTVATETRDTDPPARRQGHVHDELTTHPRRGSPFRHTRRTSSETCPSNYFQCGNSLPSNFCCPTGTTCNSLADDTTVLCCGEGLDCSSILPITCSINELNATAFPETSVHTTNLTAELPTCGDGCCPFGYACNGDSTCDLIESDSLETATSSQSPTSTVLVSTAPGTGTALVTASETAQAVSSSTSGEAPLHYPDSQNRAIAIATGTSVGVIVCIGGIIAFILLKRRRATRIATEAGRELGTQSRATRETIPVHNRSAGTLSAKDSSAPQRSPPPPPLPPKEYYQPVKRKRRSLLSWVPSFVNRTPAELPATPVSFSHWGQVQRPEQAHQPYPQESEVEEIHELEADARWVPQHRYQ